ncbi:serine O-acetyltransferase [Vibrio kanaloae]|uniref:serine O-acetyltransferase n=1 Tax=Vibrio kanaloae TaxID=170673 RepID=UPI001EFDEE9F|nr:serine acetyltransferase [Vibrio kanaloae]MCG9556004.1 serine acetyltransferase [Vibrio kanaloae]
MNIVRKILHPIDCLLIRPLKFRELKNFYYAVFKYRSYKLLLANDFSTKDSMGTQIEYYYKKKTKLPHPIGIVIGHDVKLGEGCTIYQNVTIGSATTKAPQPTLGNNVTVYANAVLIGPIHIGDNAVIGANSVVNQDVPPNATVAGAPAKCINRP